MAPPQGQRGSAYPADFTFMSLRKIPRPNIPNLIRELRQLERKTFPAVEVFSFEENILTKQNTEVLVVLSGVPNQGRLVAYAVCVRSSHRLLLHKLCVSTAHRRQGLGSALLEMLIKRACAWSCRGIDLWVHQDNYNAMRLYTQSGFLVQDTVPDYYAPGQTGVRMSHPLQP